MKQRSLGLNAVSLLAMLFLYGPIIVLVLYSFNAAHLSMTWRGATLKWYAALVHDEALLAATANSLLIALVSTIGATGLGGCWRSAWNRCRIAGNSFLKAVSCFRWSFLK